MPGVFCIRKRSVQGRTGKEGRRQVKKGSCEFCQGVQDLS